MTFTAMPQAREQKMVHVYHGRPSTGRYKEVLLSASLNYSSNQRIRLLCTYVRIKHEATPGRRGLCVLPVSWLEHEATGNHLRELLMLI